MSERVLVVGETLLDEVCSPHGETTRHLGGSPANVAVGLARLGRPVDLWTCLGDDTDGHWLAARLADAGVRLVGEPFCAERTSVATGTLDAAGQASWTFDVTWTPAPLSPAPDVVAVHVGSIGALLAPGADRVWETLGEPPSTWFRSYDLNLRASLTGVGSGVRRRVADWLAWTDVARASADDLAGLWPGESLQQVAEAWFGAGRRPGTAVLTDGAAGLHRISRFSREVHVPPLDWPVVDTVGAGDAVSAAVIDTVLRHRGEMENWGIVAARAARAGELSVTRPGAAPPTAAELDAVS